MIQFDHEPLRRALERRGMTMACLAREIGQEETSVRRALGRPLSWYVADRFAVGLGLHPVELWGDEWTAAA